MFNGDDYVTAKGVILARELRGENLLWSTLFLEGIGMVGVSSKNFLGDSEPFVWGYFYFQRLRKSTKYFMFDTDIKDTMFRLKRRDLETLKTAFSFIKAIMNYLPYEQPDDNLLVNLYWSMKLLTYSVVPPSAANWRFFWKWLTEWGLAPELEPFYSANGFLNEEVTLLSQLADTTPKEAADLFSGKIDPSIRENIFRIAVSKSMALFVQI